MAICESSGGFTPRKRVHLSLPNYNYGLEPAHLVVMPDHALDAVVLTVPEADLEIVLSVHSAISTILKLVGAVDRLTCRGDNDRQDPDGASRAGRQAGPHVRRASS